MSHASPTPQPPQRATLPGNTAAVVSPSAQTAGPPGSAVCAIRPHPDAATNPALHATPPDITDQFGTQWTWSTLFGGYRADVPPGTWVCDPSDLCGNAFEWAWSESHASDLGRQILLVLVWEWDRHPDTTATWPGYNPLWDRIDPAHTEIGFEQVEDAVLELIALGELTLDPQAIAAARGADLTGAMPTVRCWLPAYQAWALRRSYPAAVSK
jgi:hypothetical protein